MHSRTEMPGVTYCAEQIAKASYLIFCTSGESFAPVSAMVIQHEEGNLLGHFREMARLLGYRVDPIGSAVGQVRDLQAAE